MVEYPQSGEWEKPKTNWVETDVFDVEQDYLRIYGNMQYLYNKLCDMRFNMPMLYVPQVQFDTIVTDVFINSFEKALYILQLYAYPNFAQIAKEYQVGQAVWNAQDLNRIENILLNLFDMLNKEKANIRALPIIFKEGFF